MNDEIESFESEGYRKVGQVRLNLKGADLFIHLRHPGNGNRISLRVGTSFISITKNDKEIKRYEYQVY